MSAPSESDADECRRPRALVAARGCDADAAAATDDPYELAALAFDAVLIPQSDRYTVDEVAAIARITALWVDEMRSALELSRLVESFEELADDAPSAHGDRSWLDRGTRHLKGIGDVELVELAG